MQGRPALPLFLATGMIIITTSLVGCGGEELSSTWRDRPVVIDGVDAEWEGAVAYIDDKNVAIGLLNDESYLYVCLAAVDSRRVRQVLGSGLTVWFDPQGGKDRRFGINFPLGMQFSPEDRDGGDMSMPMPREDLPDPDRLKERMKTFGDEMTILGPGKNEQRMMPVASSQEIKVKLGYKGGKLVYELRVPLVEDAEHPDAVGLEDGKYVGVGFETTEIDMESMRERMKDRMGAGGPPMEGGMGGGGKRGGGMRGGRRAGGKSPERLELWTRVHLAAADSLDSL